MAHFRYPEDLFKVQRTILSRYHVEDPASFYNGQDFWTIPNDPTNRAVNALQPPYYLTLRMPGTTEPTFSLTTTFAPQKRQTLAAFMAVDSAPGPTYGTIRVLQLPRNTTVPGPTQVQNNFESEPAIAEQLTLLRRGGADVEFGNLLSLPVSGGMLYVEPVYVRATQGQGFPLLRKVLVSFGDTTVLRNSLGEALAAVFSGTGTSTGGDGETDTGDGDAGEPTEDAQADLVKAIADAQAAYEAGEQALANGDFAAYGQAQADLKAALDRAVAAQRRITGEAAQEPPADGEVTEEPPADGEVAEEPPATDAPAPPDPAPPRGRTHHPRRLTIPTTRSSESSAQALASRCRRQRDPRCGGGYVSHGRHGPVGRGFDVDAEPDGYLRAEAPTHDHMHADVAAHDLKDKGLRKGSVSIVAAVAIGLAATAPAYSLTGALGYGALESGLPAADRVRDLGDPDVLRGPGLQAHDDRGGRTPGRCSPGARWRSAPARAGSVGGACSCPARWPAWARRRSW